MPIITIDGLQFFDQIAGGGIIIEQDKIEQYVSYINDNDIHRVVINYVFGYKLDNINFINECPNIKNLSINSPFIKDYSPISYLKNLKSLSLISPFVRDYSPLYQLKLLKSLYIDRSPTKAFGKSGNAKLDLALIPYLENLSIYNCKNIEGLDECKNLNKLRLTIYNPPYKNLEELTALKNLQNLKIVKSTINSFEGLGHLQKIKRFDLAYLSNLINIDDLDNANSLLILRFESCKNIQNHEYVKKLKELKLLAFSNCGNIPSIEFIKHMPSLKAFIFVDSKVVNGDISPCIGLEYVAFMNKKHYSHSRKDFPNDKMSPEMKELFKWERANY